jgi:ubiquinol-cytochrome c reductase cytochrome b subunit
MRDVPWGWLIRYMHSTGASAFFVVVYLHMFRGLIYGSYRKPRELVWIFGCAIFLCLMAEAFMGYLLPWGQMSYWGAQVIVNLFAADSLHRPRPGAADPRRLRGGRRHAEPLLQLPRDRVPLVLLGLVAAHILALHEVGSNNPDGVEIKGPNAPKDAQRPSARRHPLPPVLHGARHGRRERLPDGLQRDHLLRAGTGRLLPRVQQLHPGRPAEDAAHIAPVWYFTPYYSMLRATTDEMVDVFCVIVCVVGAAASPSGRAAAGADRQGGHRGGGRRGRHRAAQDLRRQVLGRGRDGRRRHHPVLPALAGPQPGQVDPLPSGLAQVGVRRVRGVLLRARLPGRPAAVAHRHAVAQVGTLFYFGFFLLMPWWSRLGSSSRCRTASPSHAH